MLQIKKISLWLANLALCMSFMLYSTTQESNKKKLQQTQALIESQTYKQMAQLDPLDRFTAVTKRLYSLLYEDKKVHQLPKQDDISGATIMIKKILNPGDLLFVKGDIHGDHQVIPTMIEYLQNEGLMDQKLLLQSHVYLIFLGDYIDRGPNSIEVIRQITQLKKANPQQVFLLRGNHEEKQFLFQKSPNALIHQIKRIPSIYKQNEQIWNEKILETSHSLLYAFSLMPELLFVGTKTPKKNKINYLLFLHGGIPVKPRKEFYGKNKTKLFARDADIYNETNTQITKFLKAPQTIEFLQMQMSLNHSISGEFLSPFTWNDFAQPNKKSDKRAHITRSMRGSAIQEVNKKETQEWLKKISSNNAPITQIIRGHQQSQRDLFENSEHPGLANRWDGLVLTLDYAPRVPTFKSQYDTWLKIQAEPNGSFTKTTINFDPKTNKIIKI